MTIYFYTKYIEYIRQLSAIWARAPHLRRKSL